MPRAKFIAAPATWVWTSTPPGKTTMPLASIERPPSTSGTMRPSAMQMSWTTPRTPFAGSWTFPPVMRKESVSNITRDGLLRHRCVRSRRPQRLRRHRLADASEDLLVGRIRRLEGRSKRQRYLVHAIDGPGRADPRGRRGDVHAGQAARVRHLRIQHDGRDACEMVDA